VPRLKWLTEENLNLVPNPSKPRGRWAQSRQTTLGLAYLEKIIKFIWVQVTTSLTISTSFLGNLDQTDRQTTIEFITDKAFCRRLRNCLFDFRKILQQSIILQKVINVGQLTSITKIISIRVLRKQGSDIHRQFFGQVLFTWQVEQFETLFQWSLYPKFPDLFVKTYSKYLRLTDYREWIGSESHNLLCNLGIRPFRQTRQKTFELFFWR
jgi:hypothetical protein